RPDGRHYGAARWAAAQLALGGALRRRPGRRPSSAVLTLTSLGMAQRSRPLGREPSPVIALWKDPARGVREIFLEPGAPGELLAGCMDRTSRRSADGRWPVDNGTHAFDVAVQQLRASSAGSGTSIAARREDTARTRGRRGDDPHHLGGG